MTRKNVLQGLMGQPATPATSPAATPATDTAPAPSAASPATVAVQPRPARGAVGAVSQSLAELRARSVIEIDPHLITAGGLQDRLESDPAEDAELARSIAEYGQQVPILVRPHPVDEGRYQIVYGRRRVLAMRDLGRPVKALVRDLDDRELLLAQGQENSARRNLSFIEKVNFARQLQDSGYDRRIIGDALSIDKTLVSRMLAVAARIPADLIMAIGAAPSVGRDRWLALADLIDSLDIAPKEVMQMATVLADGPGSDDRFEAAMRYLLRLSSRLQGHPPDSDPAPAPQPKPASSPLRGSDGVALGVLRRSADTVTLRFDRKSARGFESWLLDNLTELHRRWEQSILPGSPDHD